MYVDYDGAYYEIGASVPGAPFHFVPVMIGGGLGGVGLVAIGGLGWWRDQSTTSAYPALLYAVSAIGILGLIGILWIGNVHGYIWPIQ